MPHSLVDEKGRLELIAEAVRYCQRVRSTGMPPSCYSKALREPIFYLWERRAGSQAQSARFRSRTSVGIRHGRGELVYDHAVPFILLQTALPALTMVNPPVVREILEQFGVTELITASEIAKLSSLGLGRAMPADWDGLNPLARYEAADIALIPNR